MDRETNTVHIRTAVIEEEISTDKRLMLHQDTEFKENIACAGIMCEDSLWHINAKNIDTNGGDIEAWNIDVKGNINTWNILAEGNINAGDINADTLKAKNILASDMKVKGPIVKIYQINKRTN
ncbi:MAG: hypothetical protein J7K00_03075 [Candidatus Diapherotrites archaeon]|nr:hypothetical protein [Candidatus Diapherotrites archaeon]